MLKPKSRKVVLSKKKQPLKGKTIPISKNPTTGKNDSEKYDGTKRYNSIVAEAKVASEAPKYPRVYQNSLGNSGPAYPKKKISIAKK